jgi:hypothetical protein
MRKVIVIYSNYFETAVLTNYILVHDIFETGVTMVDKLKNENKWGWQPILFTELSKRALRLYLGFSYLTTFLYINPIYLFYSN